MGEAVTATDSNTDDVLTYTLGGADAASFKIGAASGQLKTKSALNREAKDTYTVTVTATDSYGLSATITVTIMVTNVEEPPELERIRYGKLRRERHGSGGNLYGDGR